MTTHPAPSDIQLIVQSLKRNNMEVSGPFRRGEDAIYHVNGHSLNEDELRRLTAKRLLTSWDIFNYVRHRSARRTE
jgi:hypothetical protein